MSENETEQHAIVRRPDAWKTIFIGPQGPRAGWRLLIFFALIAALIAIVSFALRGLAGKLGAEFTVTTVVISESLQFGIVLIASLIMTRFERRSLADYGLPFRLALQTQFWTGALWGFVMLSIIIALMIATHAYSLGAIALSPMGVLKYGLGWALAFLLVGLFEEFVVRGYLQFTLTMGLGFWPAAAITSSLFVPGTSAIRERTGWAWLRSS